MNFIGRQQQLPCDHSLTLIYLPFCFILFLPGALPQTLVCPRLSTACPDLFCPFNCAGRGICNFDHVSVNGTAQPKCECFDSSDTSPGCSDSLIQNGDFLDDADGLLDNIEEDFFDPLVAVFVDHPDKWTSSSWAWGAGLLTVFLVMLLCICSTFWPEAKGGNKDLDMEQTYRGSSSRISPRDSSRTRKTSSSTIPTDSRRLQKSSSRERASRKNSSSRRAPDERRQSSSRPSSGRHSSSRPSKRSTTEKKRSPTSYHERYLRENHQVVSHSQHNRRSSRDRGSSRERRGHRSRGISSSMTEI